MRRCVTCGRAIAGRPENRWDPFCGERCRLVDLGKWLGEEYRVPTQPLQEGEAQERLAEDEGSDSEPTLH